MMLWNMEVIKISHVCSNTRNKTTTLKYASPVFNGIGVPLEVILRSFQKMNLVWFTLQYGQFDDNIVLLGLRELEADRLQKTMYNKVSPIEKAFNESGKFKEYILTEEVQAALGINLKTTNLSVKNHKALYQIYIHDDCLSSIEPVDQILLQEIVYNVLQQHSFYLEKITKEVVKLNSIKLKSDPRNMCLNIRREGFLPYIKGLVSTRSLCTVQIADSKASFSVTHNKR
jgi:hypothetical protein